MSSELVPYPKTDNDYTYRGVQAKLRRFEQAMDFAATVLDTRRSRMRANADKAHTLADQIHAEDLDAKFVGLTAQAGDDLSGADRDLSALCEFVEQAGEEARAIRRDHQRLYGPLDEVRSGRKVKTPTPGFLKAD